MSEDDVVKKYFEGTTKSNITTDDEFEDYEAIQKVHDVAEVIEKKRPKKGRGGTENFPSTLPNDISKSHIRKTLQNIMIIWDMEPIESDDELAERLYKFFMLCLETEQHPTWEKLCRYIGFNRSTVLRWLSGEINSTEVRRNLIKKAKEFCAIYDAELAIDGKINPIVYIFRAKNFHEMVDRVEHVANTDNALGQLKDHNEIAGRILGNIPVIAVEVDYTDED